LKRVIVIASLSTLLISSTVTLDDIIANAKPPKIIEEKITQERLSLESESLSSSLPEPISVEGAIGRKDGVDDSGFEYDIGFSREILVGDSQRLRREESRLNYEADLLEQQLEILGIENWLKDLYHQQCLDSAYVANSQEAYQIFSELYDKKQVAFRQGEISKTELLQIELERDRLQIELDSSIRGERLSKELLLSLTELPRDSSLSCVDIYPIRAEIDLAEDGFKISKEAYSRRVDGINIGLKRYNQKIDRLELVGGYTRELDSDIFTVGVSIPLNFTSDAPKYAKASLKYKSQALELEHEQKINQKSFEVRELYQKLKQDALMVEAKRRNIQDYRDRLLPMVKKSYEYGESSVIEYLLSQQRLYSMEKELLDIKRDYYHRLFKLYTVAERKDR